jgi:hypothetical protein
VETVAVRVPDQELVRALARAAGPLAVSSANLTGRPPALTAADAAAQLGAAVALCLDAGPAPGGVPSTVVDVTGPRPRILREGAISADRVAAVAARSGPARSGSAPGPTRSAAAPKPDWPAAIVHHPDPTRSAAAPPDWPAAIVHHPNPARAARKVGGA